MVWVKGQSGNPKGRPKKGMALTEILRLFLAQPDLDGATRAEMLTRKLWSLALEGNLDAIRYIYDRLDGKPTESHEIGGAGGGPITLRVVEQIVTRRNADDTTAPSAG